MTVDIAFMLFDRAEQIARIGGKWTVVGQITIIGDDCRRRFVEDLTLVKDLQRRAAREGPFVSLSRHASLPF